MLRWIFGLQSDGESTFLMLRTRPNRSRQRSPGGMFRACLRFAPAVTAHASGRRAYAHTFGQDTMHKASPPLVPLQGVTDVASRSESADLFAATALGCGASCAMVVFATVYLWKYTAEIVARQPGDSVSGGVAFSFNFLPIMWTLICVALGVLAVVFLLISIGITSRSRRRRLRPIHVSVMASLLPLAYLMFRVWIR